MKERVNIKTKNEENRNIKLVVNSIYENKDKDKKWNWQNKRNR